MCCVKLPECTVLIPRELLRWNIDERQTKMEHSHTQELTCFHYFVSVHWAALIKPTEVLFCICVAEKEKWNDGAERRLQRGPAGWSGKINDKSTLVWLRADSTYTHQQTRTQPLVGPVLSARLFVKRTDWSRVTVLCNKCLIQDSQARFLLKEEFYLKFIWTLLQLQWFWFGFVYGVRFHN